MRRIDMNAWPRREIYESFSGLGWPFWSVSFEADVTGLVDLAHLENLSVYRTMIWAVSRAADSVEAFRTEIRPDGVWVLDRRRPSYTVPVPGSDAFRIITLPAGDSAADFCRRARENEAAQTVFIDPETEGSDLLYISCLPWLKLTSLTHERNPDPDDSIPRIAWGRIEQAGGRSLVNLSVEVNHRLVDGCHIGLFARALQDISERNTL